MGLKQKLQQQKKEYALKRNIYNTITETKGEPKGIKNIMQLHRKVFAIYQNSSE